VSPPWRSGVALAKALPQLLGRLPALHGRASLPMRLPNHGGLTPTALVRECAFVQRESRFFTVERTPCAKSGGREAAVVIRNRACKSATAIARKTVARRVGGRSCSRVRVTTVGLRPPLFGPAARVCAP